MYIIKYATAAWLYHSKKKSGFVQLKMLYNDAIAHMTVCCLLHSLVTE